MSVVPQCEQVRIVNISDNPYESMKVQNGKIVFRKIKDGPHPYSIGNLEQIKNEITTEKPKIISEKEMNDILNKYNNYEPIFKLQMKIWTKLLSNDKCKELNNCSDIERRK